MKKVDHQILSKYTPVIGLEIHSQLSTESKMFSPEGNVYGAIPNTSVSNITLAHPGAMPTINKKAIEFALKMGIACESKINKYNFFSRKNYFYPDLPKGYQITQQEGPICSRGYITINLDNGKEKNIDLTRIHLEEDTGKSIHGMVDNVTLLDFNRAGTPLIEIVTEPVISNSKEAYTLLYEIRRLVRYLEICDGNMEEGSLRCDANVSVMLKGTTTFGQRVEVKNMNSIRNVQLAIEFEINRQIQEIESGNKILSETRAYDADECITRRQRVKENLSDYRYFIEPDISPIRISDKWIENIKNSMPILPRTHFKKLVKQHQLPSYDAKVITENKNIALFYNDICKYTNNYKAVSNWIMGPIKSYLNKHKLSLKDFPLSSQNISKIIDLIDKNLISFSSASNQLFNELLCNPNKDPKLLAKELNLIQESNIDQIEIWVEEIINEFPEEVDKFKNGKKQLMGLFMGEIMKKSKGTADPKIASQIIQNKLK